jgi:hypothetical protein
VYGDSEVKEKSSLFHSWFPPGSYYIYSNGFWQHMNGNPFPPEGIIATTIQGHVIRGSLEVPIDFGILDIGSQVNDIRNPLRYDYYIYYYGFELNSAADVEISADPASAHLLLMDEYGDYVSSGYGSVTGVHLAGKYLIEVYPDAYFEYVDINLSVSAPSSHSAITKVKNLPSGVIVYPNPTSGILNVNIDDGIAAIIRTQQTGANTKIVSNDPAYDLRLYDGQGNLLRQSSTKGGKVEFNVSNLPAGIYYLHIYDGISNKPDIRQIVVER